MRPGLFHKASKFCRSLGRLPGFLLLAIGLVEASFGQDVGWIQQKETAHFEDEWVVQAPGFQEKDVPAAKDKANPNGKAVPGNAKKGVQKAKKKANPAPVPARQILMDGVNIQVAERQVIAQVRYLYQSELHFMKLICQPSKAEFDRIAQDGEPAVKAMVHEFVTQTTGGRSRIIQGNAKNASADPRETLAKEIARLAEQTLSADRAALYEKESRIRAEARQRAVRESLLARLNETLLLSTDQRDKIAKILEEQWEMPGGQTRYLINGNQYFPQMPEASIVALLSAKQRELWSTIPKVNFSYRSNLGIALGFNPGDLAWEMEGVEPPPPVQGVLRPGVLK